MLVVISPVIADPLSSYHHFAVSHHPYFKVFLSFYRKLLSLFNFVVKHRSEDLGHIERLADSAVVYFVSGGLVSRW